MPHKHKQLQSVKAAPFIEPLVAPGRQRLYDPVPIFVQATILTAPDGPLHTAIGLQASIHMHAVRSAKSSTVIVWAFHPNRAYVNIHNLSPPIYPGRVSTARSVANGSRGEVTPFSHQPVRYIRYAT
jgi:hypothetical protein